MQLSPVAGGSGYGLDVGARTYPWALPPHGAAERPTFRGALTIDLVDLTTQWLCAVGVKNPFMAVRTLEAWVYMPAYDPSFGGATMPLFSMDIMEWGLKFVAPGSFQPFLVFGDDRSAVTQANTFTGKNLAEGPAPIFVGEPDTWVHYAIVLDVADDDNFIATCYINVSFVVLSSVLIIAL